MREPNIKFDILMCDIKWHIIQLPSELPDEPVSRHYFIDRYNCFFKYPHTVSLHLMAGLFMEKWLYVFVTLVLVSGILAAGCLGEDAPVPVPAAMNPSGNLQPGQVLQVFGDVTGQGIPHGTVDTIMFTVGLVPEIKSMDMEELVIVYADAIRTETLSPIAGFRGDPSPGEWGILSVQKEVGNPNNRIEFEEQFVILSLIHI